MYTPYLRDSATARSIFHGWNASCSHQKILQARSHRNSLGNQRARSGRGRFRRTAGKINKKQKEKRGKRKTGKKDMRNWRTCKEGPEKCGESIVRCTLMYVYMYLFRAGPPARGESEAALDSLSLSFTLFRPRLICSCR